LFLVPRRDKAGMLNPTVRRLKDWSAGFTCAQRLVQRRALPARAGFGRKKPRIEPA